MMEPPAVGGQVDGAGPPPMCTSCNHAHFPEVKCAVCGHKGKGKSYLLIAKVRPTSRLIQTSVGCACLPPSPSLSSPLPLLSLSC